MFDTILIGTAGLMGNAEGLRVVGNNLSNVNTPGFKGSQVAFSNLFDQSGSAVASNGGQSNASGTGLGITGTTINFATGTDLTTGNPLDTSINGEGLFTIVRNGKTLYTRAGGFQFNDSGALVNAGGDHVQGLNANGQLSDVKVDNLERSAPKATATIKFGGNLTLPPAASTVNGLTVYDANGNSHGLNLSLSDDGSGGYKVAVTDAANNASVTTGALAFSGGFPTASTSTMSFSYTPAGGAAQTVVFDFTNDVTGGAGSSNLAMTSQDGYGVGLKTGVTIGGDGLLTVHYSNGQTATGQHIALALFQSNADLTEVDGGAFSKTQTATVRYGRPGDGVFGSLVSGHLEGSNVDMAQEFSNLILMQRGYQAASHVVSTANDLVQELLDMKGNR